MWPGDPQSNTTCNWSNGGAFLSPQWVLTAGVSVETIIVREALPEFDHLSYPGIKFTYVDGANTVRDAIFRHSIIAPPAIPRNYSTFLHPRYLLMKDRDTTNEYLPGGIFTKAGADIGLIKLARPIGSRVMKLPRPMFDDVYIDTNKTLVYVFPQYRSYRLAPPCRDNPYTQLNVKKIHLKSLKFCPSNLTAIEREPAKGPILYKGDPAYQVCSHEHNSTKVPICSGPIGSPIHMNGSTEVIAVASSIITHCQDSIASPDLMHHLRVSTVMPWILTEISSHSNFTDNPQDKEFLQLSELWSAVRIRHLWDPYLLT